MAASMCSCTRRVLTTNLRTCFRYSTSSTSVQKDTRQEPEKIIIPRKKKRTPLSILEALASTVGKDPTAPRYKYHDDPFLIPASNLAKRTFALSKASGKKAARHIVNTYPKYFDYEASDPHIEALMPKSTIYTHSDVSEAALVERIDKRRVKDAAEIYKLIKQEGIQLSVGTHQRLLDLLCVYNCEDPPADLLPDEYFYRRDLGVETRKVFRRSWHDNGVAETVFDDLTEKTPESYCSLIRGMAKYLQTDKVLDYYKRMKDGSMPVDLATYNTMIYIASFCKDTYDSKWEQVLEILNDMKASDTQPDLATFNSVLFTLTRMSSFRRTPTYAMQTLAEMKNCGIEPSLASWKHIVNIVYNNEDVDSTILNEIIDNLEDQEFTLCDPDDLEFFTNAMAKCYINLKDPELAKKIDQIVTKGHNSVMLGDGHSEGIYYSFFFRLLCMFEDMDTIMEYYERIVPNMWTPSFSGIEELLKAIELHDGFHNLPQIWSDLVLFDYIRRQELLGPLLSLMAKKQQDTELSEKFGNIASYLLERWTNDFENKTMRSLELTGGMMGDMLTVSLHADRFTQAWSIFDTYKSHNRLFSGLPSEESFSLLVDACIQKEDAEKAITVLSLMYELAFPLAEGAADRVRTQMALSDLQKQHIDVLK